MGYIGSHAAATFIKAGQDVVLFDNLSNSDASVLSRLEKVTNTKISFVEGDIRDFELISKTLKQYKINAVMHFAGLKAVSDSVRDPLNYYDNNVAGSISLIRAMQENNIKKIVFSSSATVYGDPQYLPLDESHPLRAINPYGRTKIYIEEILADLAISDREWKIMSLRYFNPIGAHDSGLIGESPKAAPNNLMPLILKVAKGEVANVKIYGDDYQSSDGTGVRDYIHVLDLVNGHLSALLFLNNNSGFSAINLGTGQGYSVKEIINTFSRVTHTKVPYEIVGRRDGDVAISYSSVDRARNLLGWQAKKDLKEMCLSAWKYMSLQR